MEAGLLSYTDVFECQLCASFTMGCEPALFAIKRTDKRKKHLLMLSEHRRKCSNPRARLCRNTQREKELPKQSSPN